MGREEIVMVCCSDIAGQLRGKGFPAKLLAGRLNRGVGWTPTNIMITAHGSPSDSPWGPFGDLVLLPDMDTHTRVDFADDSAIEQFVLADICELDGSPWACCPRDFLKRGLAALEAEFGLTLKGAFEHEFHLDTVEERANAPYNLDAFRRQDGFAENFLWALAEAGVEADTFMPEFGPGQYEVTVAPLTGLGIADRAIITREMARATAHRRGGRASFTPILRPDAVGNGVHVHLSLQDAAGKPVMHDAAREAALSATAGSFAAGMLEALPALVALTAASTISYLRLTPNRWSAAYNNLGLADREAAIRICPVFETTGAPAAEQLHLEFRAADAAASPYLLLGGLVWAGIDGLRRALPAPPITTADPARMSADERAALGLERLPLSLAGALDALAWHGPLKAAMGDPLHQAYLAHKRFEAAEMAPLDDAAQCERYRLSY